MLSNILILTWLLNSEACVERQFSIVFCFFTSDYFLLCLGTVVQKTKHENCARYLSLSSLSVNKINVGLKKELPRN